jgi:prepilin-type N-terminal cleavage/methylation domain-containing protein
MTPRPDRLRPASQRGYSLVELLTTMAIFGVLAGSGLPHIDTRRQDINTVLNRVIADLRFARSRAITTGTHFAFQLNDDGTYEIQRLVEEPAPGGGTTWELDSVAKTITLPEHVQLALPDEVELIEFNTRGMMVSVTQPFEMSIADNLHGAAHTVSIWPSGQMYYED